jgi:hypothetical protein
VPARIEIAVVEGEGAVHSAGQRVSRGLVVRVVDENQQPVTGAVVVFNLPISGTTGEFTNGSKNLSVMTDRDGLAAAPDLRLNSEPGRLQVLVTASYRGLNTRALINQTVEGGGAAATHGGSSTKWILIVALIGGGAAGAAIAATHHGSSSSNTVIPPGPTPIGVTPGTVTITPPAH